MHLSEIWHSKKNDSRLSRTQVPNIRCYQPEKSADPILAQGGLSVAGRCRCLTKDSNTSIEKEGYIPYSLQA